MPTPTAKYLVRHDPATGRWNVLRGDQATGAFARDPDTAIGSATREASREAGKATVWLEEPGKRPRRVWP